MSVTTFWNMKSVKKVTNINCKYLKTLSNRDERAETSPASVAHVRAQSRDEGMEWSGALRSRHSQRQTAGRAI